MGHAIDFPLNDAGEGLFGTERPHVGAAFLAEPTPHSHAVQFYEEEGFLFDVVAHFLATGLRAGERLVVIATEAHREAFVERLRPYGVDGAIASGQLTSLDAHEALGRFMVDDMPDPSRFRSVLSGLLDEARRGGPEGARVRAYGEMVDVLWRKGNSRAAVRLEELWNDAGGEHSFELLCAYAMGNFYHEGDSERFLAVCRNHSHVLPTERFVQLDGERARLREIGLLQQRAKALESELRHRAQLELALRDALRERGRVEEELRACVQREQEARARAEESDRFKEVFLAMLGHDLRNPLSTILTTARLMVMRDEVAPDGRKRLGRLVSSGVRMQRMIDQLLDVARARLAGGIAVAQDREHDLAALVAKVVDELREAHPGRAIELRSDGPCEAFVDADRLEQVASNLLGNALTYGDPARPVEVAVGALEGRASVRVRNFGTPIDPSFLPWLFDPFRRGPRQHGRPDGLGLGLYICERIVRAHGGTIEVESSADAGTRFEIALPRRP